MGDPKKLRKKYSVPKQPFEKSRIEEENKLTKQYGMKNKTEMRRASTRLSKYRLNARTL